MREWRNVDLLEREKYKLASVTANPVEVYIRHGEPCTKAGLQYVIPIPLSGYLVLVVSGFSFHCVKFSEAVAKLYLARPLKKRFSTM